MASIITRDKKLDRKPNPKKLKMTSEDTFVIEADGGNRFEGRITDPKVQKKTTLMVSAGICFKDCANRSVEMCDSCLRFSNFEAN